MNLKAETASEEDKEWLSEALFYLRKPSTGTREGDIRKLAVEIQQYVQVPFSCGFSQCQCDCSALRCWLTNATRRLVDGLGLHSTLTEYKVPKDDLPGIAERALARVNDPTHPKVVQLLESLY